jgi:hypothetical protein
MTHSLDSQFNTDRKKTLKSEFKERKITGGVFRMRNTQSGRYLLNYAADIQAKQNSFNFATTTGNCFDNRLRKDWEAAGNGIFVFEVLETIDKKKDQTQTEFTADLQALAEMWVEKLDPAARY